MNKLVVYFLPLFCEPFLFVGYWAFARWKYNLEQLQRLLLKLLQLLLLKSAVVALYLPLWTCQCLSPRCPRRRASSTARSRNSSPSPTSWWRPSHPGSRWCCLLILIRLPVWWFAPADRGAGAAPLNWRTELETDSPTLKEMLLPLYFRPIKWRTNLNRLADLFEFLPQMSMNWVFHE